MAPDAATLSTALERVLDPELALNVVELGMVRAIDIAGDGRVRVSLALTSLACPVWDLFVDQVELALEGLCTSVAVDFVTTPGWKPDDMTEQAREMLSAVGLIPPVDVRPSGRIS